MEIGYGPEVLFIPHHLPTRALSRFQDGTAGAGPHRALHVGRGEGRKLLSSRVSDLQHQTAPWCRELAHSPPLCTVTPGTTRWPSFEIPDAPRHVQHVMFETLDMDDVGTTYDICRERDIVSTSLGRHLNDRMFSFYFQEPVRVASGVRVGSTGN